MSVFSRSNIGNPLSKFFLFKIAAEWSGEVGPFSARAIINPLKACDQCRLRSREGDGFTKKAQNDAFRTPNSKRRTRIHPSSTEPTCFVPFQHNFPMEPPPGRLYSAKISPRACGVR